MIQTDKKIVFLFWKYEPTTATFQRRWALMKGIAETGIKIIAVFLLPNNNLKCANVPMNVECFYWGDDFRLKNKLMCLLYNTIKILKKLEKGDVLFGLTFFPIIILTRLFLNSRVYSFIEYTEYPPFIYSKNKYFGNLSLFNFISFAKKQTGIFVISEKLKEFFVSEGVSYNKVHVINMIVDQNRFDNVYKNKSERYVCYCGSICNYKDGVNFLIEAFGKISKDFPDIKLYLLGSYSYEEDRLANLKIIEKYDLQDKVYMPGKVNGEDLPQYLINAEVLALARPDNIQAVYGFPTKLGEYLMTGNPVVLTNVGEISKFLTDNENCLFAKPGDSSDFAEKLRKVFNKEIDTEKIGMLGRSIALKNFNYKTEALKIAQTIKYAINIK